MKSEFISIRMLVFINNRTTFASHLEVNAIELF